MPVADVRREARGSGCDERNDPYSLYAEKTGTGNRTGSKFLIKDQLGEAVDDLGGLGLVVSGAIGAETGTTLSGSLVQHAEQVGHLLEGSFLGSCCANHLEAGTNRGTDGTVHGVGLFGLAQTLFARFVLRHLLFSG